MIERFIDKAKESEETEVKKDIEWLKEAIEGIISNYESFPDKTNWNRGYIMALYDYKGLIDQLDDPEVLSKEWIDNHTAGADTIAHYSEEDVPVVTVSDLQNLLVPKLDLPVIPDYVADEFETMDASGLMSEFESVDHILTATFSSTEPKEKNKALQWVRDNPEEYVMAAKFGYNVAEEKKYYIHDKTTNSYMCFNADKTRLSWHKSMFRFDCFTEQEIRGFDNGDILFEHFSVIVEELEE